MLTVKHVKPNGDEFILECESFFADRVEGCMTKRFQVFDTPYRTLGGQKMLWSGEPANNSLDNDTIYVMNRHGATVATHQFRPISPNDEQADPEKLAT